jgi:hypothetical protein
VNGTLVHYLGQCRANHVVNFDSYHGSEYVYLKNKIIVF